jgi:hypothetical protein
MAEEDRRSDAQLIGEVAALLVIPREAAADSFVLHAPLELVARAALLPRARPAARREARRRVTELGEGYIATGPAVHAPDAAELDGCDVGARLLVAAIDRGELDDIDRIARWLGRAASPGELRRLLAPAVLDRLAAAAHAPIFLFHLPRVSPRGEITGELLRGLARELGRNPEWRVQWLQAATDRADAPAEAMFDALAAVPVGSTVEATPFIYPTMHQVDSDGSAAALLAPVTGGADVAERGRTVLRAAAWSMLLEPGDHAPYGWSHCLTMPQAVLGVADTVADPGTALAIAATYVVGFRARLASYALEPTFAGEDPSLGIGDAIDAGPRVASAAVWYAASDARPEIEMELATRASTHADAHLAKYTIACFDAAADDPTHRRLYLSAAASLAGWWAQSDS